MTKNQTLRLRKLEESYQAIVDERISVRYAVIGLDGNPAYKDAARPIRLSEIHESLKTIEERLLEEETSVGQGFAELPDPGENSGEIQCGQ